jgi:hypothetical protein
MNQSALSLSDPAGKSLAQTERRRLSGESNGKRQSSFQPSSFIPHPFGVSPYARLRPPSQAGLTTHCNQAVEIQRGIFGIPKVTRWIFL